MKTYNVVFMGKSGTGKTSTINNIFGLSWPTNAVEECTKLLFAAWIKDDIFLKDIPSYDSVMVIDTPGISAALENDKHYMSFYEYALSIADCLVWVSQGNTRSDRADQEMLLRVKDIIKPELKIVVCVNHIDKIGAEYKKNWPVNVEAPNEVMNGLIAERCEDLRRKFSEIGYNLSSEDFVPCSGIRKYGYVNLLKKIF